MGPPDLKLKTCTGKHSPTPKKIKIKKIIVLTLLEFEMFFSRSNTFSYTFVYY